MATNSTYQHVQSWWNNLQPSDRDELLMFLYTLYHYCANHIHKESHALNDLKRKLTEQFQTIITSKDAQIEFLRDQFNLRIESSVKEVSTRLDTIIPSILNPTTYDKGKQGEVNFDDLIRFQYGDEIEIEDISKSKNCGDRLLTLETDIQCIVEIKNHSRASQEKNRKTQYETLQQNLQFARQQISESIHIAICAVMTDVPIGRGKDYLDIVRCSFTNSPDGICIIVSGIQQYPHNLYAAIEMTKVLHGMLSTQSDHTDTLLNLVRANFPTLQKVQSNLQKWERTVNQLRIDINKCEREQLNPFIYNLLSFVDATNTKHTEKLNTILDILKDLLAESPQNSITREVLENKCKERGLRATTLIKNYGGIRVLKNMALNQLKEINERELPPLPPITDKDQ